ncbi:hypothetical protein [Laceyella putida]|uniref:Uncharacterized protein n=1 Tax=Laceyella putida TaxID=110101 RepID=A0ABW2RLW0_9BACL
MGPVVDSGHIRKPVRTALLSFREKCFMRIQIEFEDIYDSDLSDHELEPYIMPISSIISIELSMEQLNSDMDSLLNPLRLSELEKIATVCNSL